tara:strand:+ start:190 stop:1638 length:1449 start_codon:yes stop_codon:yes gene_type:complete
VADGDRILKSEETLREDLLDNKRLEEGGQFEISHCLIVTKKGEINISKMITSLSVWEHIFRVFITAEIIVHDVNDVIANADITGTEPVHLEFRTLGSKFPVSINMVISHIKDRKKVAQTANDYTFSLISPEFLSNQRVKISTCYKEGPEAAVKDIFFNRLGSNQKLWIEDTENSNKIIIPNKSPTDALEILSQFTKSKEGNASYLFFQTTKSFHYRSYADMINAKRQGLSFTKASEDPNPGANPLAKCSRILEFDVDSDVDILKQTKLGTYASHVIEYDICNKAIIPTTLDYHKDAFNGNIKKLGKHPITPGGPVGEDENSDISSFSNSKVELIIAARTANYRVYNLEAAHESGVTHLDHENKPRRMAEINSMLIQRAKVKIAGISGIQAGDIININIHKPLAEEGISKDITTPNLDKKLSGNWLIESVAHNIVVNDKYYCEMYIIRDSVDTKQTDYELLNYNLDQVEHITGDNNRTPDLDF